MELRAISVTLGSVQDETSGKERKVEKKRRQIPQDLKIKWIWKETKEETGFKKKPASSQACVAQRNIELSSKTQKAVGRKESLGSKD